MANILEVKNLATCFHTFYGDVKAVNHISFSMKEGEILGVVGESGGGKSITGFSIIRLIDPPGEVTADALLFDGEDLLGKNEKEMNKIRGNKITMVFQDPMTSLNPVYTIEHQIAEVLRLHQPGLSKEDCRKRCIELLKEVGIPNAEERLKCYPHQFSGGMRQRVVIAIALAGSPKLIIADEPTTALDVTIQAQVLQLMARLVKEKGCALMLITHDLAVVNHFADDIAVMYLGKIVEKAPAEELFTNPLHPYTKALLSAIPIPELGVQKERIPIKGEITSPINMPDECRFFKRCQYACDKCKAVPPLVEVTPGHFVACFRQDELN